MPEITVVCASGPRQLVELRHTLNPASTVGHVLHELTGRLGLDTAALEECVSGGRVGVWGKPVPLSRVLVDGDRLELYRPLIVDPKVARRERFKRQGAKSAGLFAKRRPGAKAGY